MKDVYHHCMQAVRRCNELATGDRAAARSAGGHCLPSQSQSQSKHGLSTKTAELIFSKACEQWF